MISEEESDFDENLMPKAFIVNNYEEFDLNLPPTSGNEYLRRVQEEYKNCPKVVVANIDTSKFLANQTVRVNQSECMPAPAGYAPSSDWQHERVSDFSDLRREISSYKQRLRLTCKKIVPPVKFPSIDDDVGWCQFCFGNQSSVVDQPDFLEKEKQVVGHPPLLSVVCAMTQPLVEHVLSYHVSWMEVTGFTQQQGRWFYALLACLEKPLTPEVCSTLRSLARACATLRATLSSNEEPLLVPLNLLICLVARYFDQKDLADN